VDRSSLENLIDRLLDVINRRKSFRIIYTFVYRYPEILFALLYFLVFDLTSAILSLDKGYDPMHHGTHFMTSYRIWHGQVPTRDFVTWFGPLYHYLFAFQTWLLGGDMWAVKFNLDIVHPILSLAMLILSLHWLRLSGGARLFIIFAVCLLGVHNIFYCGSTRGLLGVLFVAWWYRSGMKGSRIGLFGIMPSVLLTFFYSQDVGSYLLPAALVFMTLYSASIRDRKILRRALVWQSAGTLVTIIAAVSLFKGTKTGQETLFFARAMSEVRMWHMGQSFPGLARILSSPIQLLHWAPMVILGFAGVLIFSGWMRHRARESLPCMSATMIVYGILLYYSDIIRTDTVHLLFVLAPPVIVAGMLWEMKPRRGLMLLKAVLVVAVLLCKPVTNPFGSHFLPRALARRLKAGTEMNIQSSSISVSERRTQELLGVNIFPSQMKMVDEIRSFAGERGKEKIAFPLNSIGYYLIDKRPDMPFDNLFYTSVKEYRELLFNSLERLRPQYIVLDRRNIFHNYTWGDIDPLFDYIDENFRLIKHFLDISFYERRQWPVRDISRLFHASSDKIDLDANGGFSFIRDVPDGFNCYLEWTSEFKYPINLLHRLSLPMVECSFDGQAWTFPEWEHGRRRINNSPGIHRYRFYVPPGARRLKFRISFPGALNIKPTGIVIEEVRWYAWAIRSEVPRTKTFLERGY
jgi:hypothetical protein